MLERLAFYGLRTTRAASAWNDPVALAADKELVGLFGIRFVADLVFSVSPRHTDDYYVERAQGIAQVRPYRVCLKDVGGLLTPERVRTLVPRLLTALDGIELEFHAHSNNGLAPLNVLAAVESGIRIVHVATPPLASGTSQPSVLNVVGNLQARGFVTGVDLSRVAAVSEHLKQVAHAEQLPVGVPLDYDEHLYRHQVPGGMISNLAFQLEQLGVADRLEETLEEIEHVRIDFGYPIMITPLSQFVGTQAVLNVVNKKRYELVSDETILYAMGHWGNEAIDVMDPQVRQEILDRPRAAQLEIEKPTEPSLAELRNLYGRQLNDEQLILRVYVGEEAEKLFTNPSRSFIRSHIPGGAANSIADVVKAMTAVSPGRRYMRVEWRMGQDSVALIRRPSPSPPSGTSDA
jgi:oxaloacetate decarboxylase alpha subunit